MDGTIPEVLVKQGGIMEIGGAPGVGKTTLWAKLVKTGSGYLEADMLRAYVFLKHNLKIRHGEPDHDIWHAWRKDHPLHNKWVPLNDEMQDLANQYINKKDILYISHSRRAKYILFRPGPEHSAGLLEDCAEKWTQNMPKHIFMHTMSRMAAAVSWLADFGEQKLPGQILLSPDEAYAKFKGMKGVPELYSDPLFQNIVYDYIVKKNVGLHKNQLPG